MVFTRVLIHWLAVALLLYLCRYCVATRSLGSCAEAFVSFWQWQIEAVGRPKQQQVATYSAGSRQANLVSERVSWGRAVMESENLTSLCSSPGTKFFCLVSYTFSPSYFWLFAFFYLPFIHLLLFFPR